jgi:MOSC domain-containing protein YiiM
MFDGEVVEINVADESGGPMRPLDAATLVLGKGIEGDRYATSSGTYSDRPGSGREITLIEVEAVEALAHENGIEITPADTRRNIVTRGVPLNHLVGREFTVGEVTLVGRRLNEPCVLLAKRTSDGVRTGLVHRGGLRADIVHDGVVRVGDRVLPA